jgi:hypothetical protein
MPSERCALNWDSFITSMQDLKRNLWVRTKIKFISHIFLHKNDIPSSYAPNATNFNLDIMLFF